MVCLFEFPNPLVQLVGDLLQNTRRGPIPLACNGAVELVPLLAERVGKSRPGNQMEKVTVGTVKLRVFHGRKCIWLVHFMSIKSCIPGIRWGSCQAADFSCFFRQAPWHPFCKVSVKNHPGGYS